MPYQKNENIARRWFSAFNSKNLDALLSLYDDDAEHFSPKLKIKRPETGGLVTGKAAMREWWQDAFDKIPSLQYDAISLTANEQRVFMEYIRRAEGESDIRVAEVLEIRHGSIIASRVYHG